MLLLTPLNVLIVKVRSVHTDATAVSNPSYSTIYGFSCMNILIQIHTHVLYMAILVFPA